MSNPQPLRALVHRYTIAGPRYTSYPTAVQFGPLPAGAIDGAFATAAARRDDPWSVYVHVPFCAKRCRFCACAVIASPDHDRVAPRYVDALERELEHLEGRLGERRGLAELHLGGGTPTYLEPALLERVFSRVLARFDRLADAEISIELDPRVTELEHLDVLARVGVTRVSLGVQDLDAAVQSAIGRVQSRAVTATLMEAARARGIRAINVDLVYGLPEQTEASLLRTLDAIVESAPSRIAFYGYAHVPWMRGNQRSIAQASLPGPAARLQMFLAARERLLGAGYQAIGLDHFARPDDALAVAAAEGRLQRNFMGYTVRSGADLLGLGVTAIGDVAGTVVQNTGKLSVYERALAQGRSPVERGLVRTADDRMRERIIMDLMCRHRVDKRGIESAFGLDDFDRTFAVEREALRPMLDDGLVDDDADRIAVTELGRPFVRNVAMAFDAHLVGAARRHSATV